MLIIKCSCSLEVAVVYTKKGRKIKAEIYHDGEYNLVRKNNSPLEHRCQYAEKKENRQSKRKLG